MSDFGPGDLVVFLAPSHSRCPNAERHRRAAARYKTPFPLVVGRHYVVASLGFGGSDGGGLHLVGVESRTPAGFCCGRFRKIDRADEGFATWMRSLRPLKETQQPYRIEVKAGDA